MAIIDRLKRLLDAERVPYLVWPHREVFTAPEVAATSEFPAREVAKVLVVRDGDGASLMVVLPALCRLSLAALELSASGTVDRAGGGLRFTEIVLRPRLTLGPGADRDRAVRVLQKAEKTCLVSASLATPIRLEPEIVAGG